MHNVHIEKSPRYLADIVQSTSSRATRSGLRSLSDSYTTPSSESGLSPLAQRYGALSLLKLYAPSLTQVFLRTSKNLSFQASI